MVRVRCIDGRQDKIEQCKVNVTMRLHLHDDDDYDDSDDEI